MEEEEEGRGGRRGKEEVEKGKEKEERGRPQSMLGT